MRSGVGELTPSELRVARLAAEGRSNRDIAQELYVTVRTVEAHLGHAYRKLGVEGRPGLAAALAPGAGGYDAPGRSPARTRAAISDDSAR